MLIQLHIKNHRSLYTRKGGGRKRRGGRHLCTWQTQRAGNVTGHCPDSGKASIFQHLVRQLRGHSPLFLFDCCSRCCAAASKSSMLISAPLRCTKFCCKNKRHPGNLTDSRQAAPKSTPYSCLVKHVYILRRTENTQQLHSYCVNNTKWYDEQMRKIFHYLFDAK